MGTLRLRFRQPRLFLQLQEMFFLIIPTSLSSPGEQVVLLQPRSQGKIENSKKNTLIFLFGMIVLVTRGMKGQSFGSDVLQDITIRKKISVNIEKLSSLIFRLKNPNLL